MSILTDIKLWWLKSRVPTHVMDHVEVPPVENWKTVWERKRAEAKANYGKEFHCDETKPRETEKSRDLLEYEEASARAASQAHLERISKVRTITRIGK